MTPPDIDHHLDQVLRAAGAGAGWQPIETCPRDGTKVRLNHSRAAKGYDTTGRWSEADGCWQVASFFIGADMRMYRQPDQWQPFPPPPPTEEGE